MQIPGNETKQERDKIEAIRLNKQTTESLEELTPRERFLLAIRIMNEAPSKLDIFPDGSPDLLAATTYEASKVKSLNLGEQTIDSVKMMRHGEGIMLAVRVITEAPEKAEIFLNTPEDFIAAARYIRKTPQFKEAKTSVREWVPGLLKLGKKDIKEALDNKEKMSAGEWINKNKEAYSGTYGTGIAQNFMLAGINFIEAYRKGKPVDTMEESTKGYSDKDKTRFYIQKLKDIFAPVPNFIPDDFMSR